MISPSRAAPNPDEPWKDRYERFFSLQVQVERAGVWYVGFGGPVESVDHGEVLLKNIVLTRIDGISTPNTDADDDGLNTLAEAFLGSDPDHHDTDGDGVGDGDEWFLAGSDPTKTDTDGDTLPDGDEMLVLGTSPVLLDTDGDYASDDAELLIGSDPLNPGSTPYTKHVSNLQTKVDAFRSQIIAPDPAELTVGMIVNHQPTNQVFRSEIVAPDPAALSPGTVVNRQPPVHVFRSEAQFLDLSQEDLFIRAELPVFVERE